MAPKRKKTSEASSATSQTDGSQDTLLNAVVSEWRIIAGNKPRSLDLLSSLIDGVFNQESPAAENPPDCYWFFLATHMMNKLLAVLEQPLYGKSSSNTASSKESASATTVSGNLESVARVLADLIHHVSKALVMDKSKFERSSTRQEVVARAMVTISLSALTILQTKPNCRVVVWQSLTALEMILTQSTTKLTPSLDGWHHAMTALVENLVIGSEEETKAVVDIVEQIIPATAEEQACLSALVSPEGATPSKRRNRSKKTASVAGGDSALVQAFSKLLENTPPRTTDGRATLRRWPALAFVWLAQGPERLLETAIDLLQSSQEISTFMECPSVEKPVAVSPTMRKSKVNKKQKVTSLIAVPGKVALCAFVVRILDLISEAMQHCGSGAPTAGSMDEYVNFISIFPGTAGGKSTSSAPTPNICDMAVLVMHQLLDLHTQCMEECCSGIDEDVSGRVILNDDGNGSCILYSNETPAAARFCPQIHRTLDSVCRAIPLPALSLIVPGSSKAIHKMLTLASCFVLQNFRESRAVDAKVFSFALTQMNQSLNAMLQDDDSGSDNVKHFQSPRPLPAPSLPKSSKGKGKRNKDDDISCTFAGILPVSKNEPTVVEELLLPLYFRAVQTGTSNKEAAPSAFYSLLLDVLDGCYRVGTVRQETLPSKAPQRKNKRAKKNTEKLPRLRRLNSIRAGLASDVCNSLRLCIQDSVPRPKLLAFLRQSLSTQQILRLVRLNGRLDAIMTKASNENDSVDSTAAAVGSSLFTPSNFNLYERTLWTSHTNLALVVGRGDILFRSTKYTSASKPILGDAASRLAIFKEIPSACEGHSDISFWPLHLPASHHALLLANLTSEPISAFEYEPEAFIANALIQAISKALEDPSIVTLAKVFAHGNDSTSGEIIPLSIADGRLLLLAISRLPYTEQITQISGLTDSLASSFTRYQKDSRLIADNPEVAQFMARVITVYFSLLNIVVSSLRDVLFRQVGCCQFALPQVFLVRDILDGSATRGRGNWYKRESCFMGLFEDWESPAIPKATDESMNVLPDGIIAKSNKVLDIAFELGFLCADRDNGHLVFAAWNASGRKRTWLPRGPIAASIKPFSSKLLLAPLVLELREELCNVYFQINNMRGPWPESLLGQILKSSTIKSPSLKITLTSMVDKAVKMTEYLKGQMSKKGALDPVELTLAESLAVYISFAIAMHTRTNNSPFLALSSKRPEASRTRRRFPTSASGYDMELIASIMSDEDSANTEDEDDCQEGSEENRIDALSRLHDMCRAFGAAPMHPDWLDKACTLAEGLSVETAKENAVRALQCLTELGSIALEQRAISMRRFLELLSTKEDEELASVVTSFCGLSLDRLNRILVDGDEADQGDFQRAVASVFGYPHKAILDLYNDASSGWRSAKEAWVASTPQQIIGLMQNHSIDCMEASFSECRASGEWEILFAVALVGSCTWGGVQVEDTNHWKSFDLKDKNSQVPAILDVFFREESWQRISSSTVSHLMPVAALLRFCINGGSGRNTHPLSLQVSNATSGAVNLIEQPMNPSLSLSPEQQVAIVRCITMLADRAARSDGDDFLQRSCRAVASNLLVDDGPFEDIEGLIAMSVAFHTLSTIQKAISWKSTDHDRYHSIRYLLQRLTLMIQSRGRSLRLGGYADGSRSARLLAFLSSSTLLKASVIGSVELKSEDVLKNEQRRREDALRGIIHIICGEDEHVQAASRSCMTIMLGEVVMSEYSHDTLGSSVRSSLQMILTSLSATQMKKIVELVYPSTSQVSVGAEHAVESATGLSKILAHALSGKDVAEAATSTFCNKMLGHMLGRLEDTVPVPACRESCLGVVLLYACRIGALDAVGSILVKKIISTSGDCTPLYQMECLLTFVCGIQGHDKSDDEKDDAKRRNSQSAAETHLSYAGSHDTVPRACSYVLRNGFFQQHWYNCYTCGLIFDKGCCTLCALTCHRGHEVSYSRYSSFFCDCGAETADSNNDHNRVACKCIAQLSCEEAEKIFEEDRSKNFIMSKNVLSVLTDDRKHHSNACRGLDMYIAIARRFEESSVAEEQIKNTALKSSWASHFFDLIKEKAENKEGSSQLMLGTLDQSQTAPETAAAVLRGRCGHALILERQDSATMTPIRAARAGSFDVKMSVDSTTDRLKRAMLSRRGISRVAAVADGRGRFVVAEPCSLVFCSLFPAVNIRYIQDPTAHHFGRGQCGIIASYSISFNIVGMQLSNENDRYLVVWGTAEACVFVLKSGWNGVENKISVELDLDPHDCDTDYVIRCDWVPGTHTQFSVACGSFVKIFDISSCGGDGSASASGVISYTLAFEAIVRDIAWVCLPFPSTKRKGEPRKRSLVLYLLMDTGRLHEIPVDIDAHGSISATGVSYLERSDTCVEIPTAGVRMYEGITPGQAGSSTRSMGEGSNLFYLRQSNILLYKCLSSCVVALVLNEFGSVTDSFELLPNRLDPGVLGNEPDSYSILGPFTRWTELGVADDGSFRLVAIGKSSRTNQPKMVSILLSDKTAKVKELAWSSGGAAGLGLSMSASFEALVPFSVPSISDGVLSERLFLSTFTSNGAVLFFGEEQDVVPSRPPATQAAFSLTAYENFYNITEVDKLTYASDGIGSDSDGIKAKLSPKNSLYLMSPSRDGCTISVSLIDHVDVSKLAVDEMDSPVAKKGENRFEELVVVALRILVGSTTTDCVPSKLFIQGRPVAISREKRWHDLPLTLEEVIVAVRSGVISIGVGPAVDSGNNPLIDSMEVYAIEKRKILNLFPPQLESTRLLRPWSSDGDGDQEGSFSGTLNLTTKVLSLLYQLLGTSDRLFSDILERVGPILRDLLLSVGTRPEASNYTLLINLLRWLNKLIGVPDEESGTAADDGSDACLASPKSKDKTDPRFVCDVHGVPAVRRRCSSGTNKNRRFYVCGMERKQRCKYFRWADETPVASKLERAEPLSWFEKGMQSELWIFLNKKHGDDEGTLSEQLCNLLEVELSGIEASPVLARSGEGHGEELLIKQKLAERFMEAALELISTVSSSANAGEQGHKRWFSLLCEVISKGPSSTPRFRSQCKAALKRMCGDDRVLYHAIRDHHVFAFQFREVLSHAYAVLDGALCVREQARQCGDKWQGSEITFEDITAGGLLGTADLISEDWLTTENSKRLAGIIDEVMTVAKNRGGNWRKFCSLTSLPGNERAGRVLLVNQERRKHAEHLFGGPPILSLFWLCCSTSGPNQVKVLKLIDLALTCSQEARLLTAVHISANVESPMEDSPEVLQGQDSLTDNPSLHHTLSSIQKPEDILLKGPKGLTPDDIVAFIMQLVVRGRTAEVRRHASQISIKLCQSMDSQSFASLFKLLTSNLPEIEVLGCASLQYLQLLQTILKDQNPEWSLDLTPIACRLAHGFVEQIDLLTAIDAEGPNALEGVKDTSLLRRMDVDDCVYCHRVHNPFHKNHSQSKASSQPSKDKKSLKEAKNKVVDKGAGKESGPQWLPDQVRPYTRGRLDTSTDNTSSSEFALFIQLKVRLSISEVHLTVNDPRGRFVKTAVVFFTPRQVSDVNQLKSEDYQPLWQECGTLSLNRGSTSATCVLEVPVTAANLKIEYRDFHDRGVGTRATDGSPLLFCPRCSRQVNNAHGVCGNCGECIFQCRRCRHIQYDRPDAFLCVECGHCSSGSFTYELTAGAASNAVAVVDDECRQRTQKTLKVATKLHSDLQSTLVERLRASSKKRSHSEDDLPPTKDSPALKRALIGDMPKFDEEGGDKSSDNKANPSQIRTDARSSINAASRARSLLRLARQLRSENSDVNASGGLLVREAVFGGSHELSVDDLEDAEGVDIVGLFGSSGDRNDPLSRLVANISSQRAAAARRNNEGSGGGGGGDGGGGGSGNRTNNNSKQRESAKPSASECEKLYQLMREAERECYELRKRLHAWDRLEHDTLPEMPLPTVPESFVPTKCSRCAGPVTLHLLMVLVRLLQSNKISAARVVITKDLVRSLLVESPWIERDLSELKHVALVTMCRMSDHAAKLVLEELRLRFRALPNEAGAAAILGKLLESGEFGLSQEFVALAKETLNENCMLSSRVHDLVP